MSRIPAVADMFYPGDKDRLNEQLAGFISPAHERKKAIAAVSPHAGYIYSGGVAGAVFSLIEIPQAVVILGPNHRGIGASVAVSASGTWQMPLGSVPINQALAESIMNASLSGVRIEDDPSAHKMEHSIEVQVPFLQFLRPDVSIVPIALSHIPFDSCQKIAQALATGVKNYGKDVLLVASTDMTHYESQNSAKAKDQLAMDRILALDPRGLLETVSSRGISMCGVIPTTIVLEASKTLGARKVELARYATSGDVSGDYAQVVGYAGFIIL